MHTAATPAKEQEQENVAALDPAATPTPEAELLDEEEENIGSTFWDFMRSKPGQAIAEQLLGMLHAIQRSTIEANADANKQQLTNAAKQQEQQVAFQHRTIRFWMWLQGIVFASCLLSTVYLTIHDKMNGTAATVICTTLGYLFGRNAKS